MKVGKLFDLVYVEEPNLEINICQKSIKGNLESKTHKTWLEGL